MARKWVAFLRPVHTLKMTGYGRVLCRLGLCLLGLCLALALSMPLAVMPAWSREPQSKPVASTEMTTEMPAEQWVRVGQAAYETGQYRAAITALEKAIQIFRTQGETSRPAVAITRTNLGNAQLALGRPEAALKSWEAATEIFSDLEDAVGIVRSQVYQTRALRDLGLNLRACDGLGEAVLGVSPLSCENLAGARYQERAIAALKRQSAPVPAIGLHTLGDIFRAVGELDASYNVLNSALGKDASDGIVLSPQAEATIRLSLANTLRAKGNLERDRQASPVYDYLPWRYVKSDSFETSEDCGGLSQKSCYTAAAAEYKAVSRLIPQDSNQPYLAIRIQAEINLLRLYIEREEISNAISLWDSFKEINIDNLPPNRTTVYTSINLAKTLAYLKELERQESITKNVLPSWQTGQGLPSWQDIEAILQNALEKSRTLSDDEAGIQYIDNLAQSYSLGNLAGLYEYCISPETDCNLSVSRDALVQQSQALTQEALLLVQPDQQPDIAYQWQWQLGRLAEAQGDREVAIAYYSDAIATLESVRSNLLVVNSDVQFSFRDNVEPLYRGSVNLLLQPSQYQDLEKARKLIDNLQLAELENFLQCNWQSKERIPLDQLVEEDEASAIIYPILLEDHLEVIVKTPNQIRLYSHENLNRYDVESAIKELRQLLVRPRPRLSKIHELSNKLYAWLIREAEKDKILDPDRTKTLIFVLDGPFRDLPMATLYDIEGSSYLIERYAISLSVGLELPILDQKDRLKALVAGQSQNTDFPGFGALPGIESELHKVTNVFLESGKIDYVEIPSESLDRDSLFNATKSSDYDIIHLATHGNFSSEPKDTFIIPAPGQKIYFSELDELFQANPQNVVKLLVLSACQTATGDSRAVLGLSGVTIQAGVRSTLGTLWSVDDRATAEFMKLFYENLDKASGIAEALQQAQISFLKGGEVGYERFRNYKDPRLWAPYMIVGNWQKVVDF